MHLRDSLCICMHVSCHIRDAYAPSTRVAALAHFARRPLHPRQADPSIDDYDEPSVTIKHESLLRSAAVEGSGGTLKRKGNTAECGQGTPPQSPGTCPAAPEDSGQATTFASRATFACRAAPSDANAHRIEVGVDHVFLATRARQRRA